MWRRAATKDRERGEDDGYEGAGVVENRASVTVAVASPGAAAPGVMEDRRGDLHKALVAFRAAHPDGVYSAKRTIDPLLDVWALALAVDRTAARPVESVLHALVERSVVTAGELSACVDRVEVALALL
jgi:hypothetical protein